LNDDDDDDDDDDHDDDDDIKDDIHFNLACFNPSDTLLFVVVLTSSCCVRAEMERSATQRPATSTGRPRQWVEGR